MSPFHRALARVRTAISRATLAVWAPLIVLLSATIAAPAAAQIVAGSGQIVSVPPNTIITCTNCSALLTQGPPGGVINAIGPFTLNVDSTGVFATGAFVPANTGGSIALANGTINNSNTAGGLGAQGVITQTAGLITGTNVTINGSGFGSTALAAEGGQITWTGGAITMTGNSASGVITAWSGGAVTVNGTMFPNPVSQGVELGGGGTVTLNGVNMTTTSFGVFAHQAFSPAPNVFTMNGGSLTAVRPFDVGLATGTPSEATFNVGNGAVVTPTLSSTGLLRLMDVVSGSTGTLNASNSTLNGSIFTDGTSTSNVNLTNGTIWNIQGPENSSVTNLINSASTINFPVPVGNPTLQSSYLTLTTMNYAGTGGRLVLNTFLGGDSSPSDRLIIQGTATGSTALTIHNTTGPGAETTSNGIPVVVTTGNGTTAPGAFSLAGEVRAGAFDYDLFRGGHDPAVANDWFLRSHFIVPPEPPGPPPPGPVPPPVLPPSPPPTVLPPGVYPIIGPELATDGVVQPIARQMGLQTLGTLHQRVGDTLV
jgi:hypothetical protein